MFEQKGVRVTTDSHDSFDFKQRFSPCICVFVVFAPFAKMDLTIKVLCADHVDSNLDIVSTPWYLPRQLDWRNFKSELSRIHSGKLWPDSFWRLRFRLTCIQCVKHRQAQFAFIPSENGGFIRRKHFHIKSGITTDTEKNNLGLIIWWWMVTTCTNLKRCLVTNLPN